MRTQGSGLKARGSGLKAEAAGLGRFGRLGRRELATVGLLVLGALWLAVPMVGSGYLVSLLLLTAMYTALASSWNLISGFTGYVSFGHAAFYGIGAYAAGLLLAKRLVAWPAAVLAAGVVAALLALALGYPALRLRGPYFAVAMLGLAEAVRVAVTVAEPLTGGGKGLTLPPTLNLVPAYYAMGILATVAVGATWATATSPAGLRLIAIREDELAAEVAGVHTTAHKMAAFCASAALAGATGGLYAWYAGYIDPVTVFASGITVRAIAMTMLGGQGTVWGPVLGAVVLTATGEALWVRFPFLHTVLFGALIVLLIVLLPGGIITLLQQRGWLPRARWV
ncbi:MAG TPA: branched-chain amino acid ABC transporter permease [Chloroflexota bacterium]|nr:branched-chain amino acid ABC transporter permease [Chloroflexota bacterium]